MSKQQRIALAQRLADIATRHGAAITTIAHEPRTATVTAVWTGHVNVSFDLDNLHAGGILATWYGAERPLALDFADSVNPHHRRKATLYRGNPVAFAEAFAECCRRVESGEAFDA